MIKSPAASPPLLALAIEPHGLPRQRWPNNRWHHGARATVDGWPAPPSETKLSLPPSHRAPCRSAAARQGIGKGRTLDLLGCSAGYRPAPSRPRPRCHRWQCGSRRSTGDSRPRRCPPRHQSGRRQAWSRSRRCRSRPAGYRWSGPLVTLSLPRPAKDQVAIVVAGNPVVLRRTDHLFHVEQPVARGTRRRRCHRTVHANVHAGRCRRIVGDYRSPRRHQRRRPRCWRSGLSLPAPPSKSRPPPKPSNRVIRSGCRQCARPRPWCRPRHRRQRGAGGGYAPPPAAE